MQLVEVPGLGNIEFPDGTSKEVMQVVIKRAIADRRSELESDVKAYATPAGKGERFKEGAERIAAGTAQLFSRPAAAIANQVEKVTGDTRLTDYMQDLPRQTDQIAQDQLYDQQRATMGLEGMDWAGLGGEMAALAPVALASAPASLPGLVGTGAAIGGTSGALSPTEGGEGFGVRKALQTGVGTAAGAVAAPVAKGVMSALNAGGSAMISQLRKLGPSPTPAQIQVTINQTLQNAGIDPASLPQGFMQDITKQVHRALRVGGQLDDEALANRAAFEAVGAQGTKGQITQNPSQYGKELFLREAPGGEALGAQYKNTLQTLNQRLGEMQPAPPINRVEAGRQTMGVLKEADDRGRQLVSGLYKQANERAGQGAKMDAAKFANDVYAEIEQEVAEGLPGGIATALNRMSKGEMDLTVNSAERLRKAVNRAYGKADDATRYSLDILKRRLDEAGAAIADASGAEASAAYKVARKAASERFAVQDAIPALRDTVQGKVAPDDFLRKHVYGAKLDDFRAFSKFIQQASPQSWQQVRGQVMSDLQQAASPNGDPGSFSQHGFNKMLRTLEQSGKLEVLFKPSEVQMLKNIGKVGRLTQQGPAGVSRTGLSGAAKASAMLTRMVGRFPLLGRFGTVAQSVAERGGNTLQASAATLPPPVASKPAVNVLAPQLANRLAPLAGPTALFPFSE